MFEKCTSWKEIQLVWRSSDANSEPLIGNTILYVRAKFRISL